MITHRETMKSNARTTASFMNPLKMVLIQSSRGGSSFPSCESFIARERVSIHCEEFDIDVKLQIFWAKLNDAISSLYSYEFYVDFVFLFNDALCL